MMSISSLKFSLQTYHNTTSNQLDYHFREWEGYLAVLRRAQYCIHGIITFRRVEDATGWTKGRSELLYYPNIFQLNRGLILYRINSIQIWSLYVQIQNKHLPGLQAIAKKHQCSIPGTTLSLFSDGTLYILFITCFVFQYCATAII